jgi:subtilisin family serine protease
MHGRHDSGSARYDRARLLWLGAAAAATPAVVAARSQAAADLAQAYPPRETLPAGIKAFDNGAGGYHYRPQRLLATGGKNADLVAARLKKAGVKFRPPVTVLEARERGSTAIVEFRIVTPIDIPKLLVRLRPEVPPKSAKDAESPVADIAIAPEYVSRGEPDYQGGPGGPPHPTQETVAFPGTAAAGPRVAVIDTGYFWKVHPDLDDNVVTPQNAADEDRPDDYPVAGVLDREPAHGMFITGLILEQAPKARIAVARALKYNGFGYERDIASAILAHADSEVINLSLGAYVDPRFPPLLLTEALRRLPQSTAVVAAAGNNHSSQPMFPAAAKRVVGVGAVDRAGRRVKFTNYGWWVDACAPAVELTGAFIQWPDPPTTAVFNGWARWSGTSFATPKVAGKIASMISATLTARQAADALIHDPAALQVPDLGTFLDL